MRGDGALLDVIQLDVPVHVVAPALGRVPETERDADGRRLLGTLRRANERHARLLRRASALLPVAGDTATDDVLPVLAATLCDRHDVVERQLAARERFAAVLTAVIVSGVDVGAREGHVVESALDADA